MVIKSFHELDEPLEEQIRELEEICNLAEKPHLQSYVYLESDAGLNRDCFYLLYEDGILAGFLSVFAAGEDGEITSFVHPKYRRRGFFTAMLKQASHDWKDLKSLSLVVQPASSSVPAVARKLNASLSFSEYMMDYNRKALPKEKTPQGFQPVTLAKAGPSDTGIAVPLLASLFQMKPEDADGWFSRLCESPDTTVYLARAGKAVVGTGCFTIEDERMTVFAVGVKKALRGRGYGLGILRRLIEQWEQKYKNMELCAELDSEHPAAVSLFKKYGFETYIQFDYYKLPRQYFEESVKGWGKATDGGK